MNQSSIAPPSKSCTDCHTTTTPLWRGGPAGPRVKFHFMDQLIIHIHFPFVEFGLVLSLIEGHIIIIIIYT